MNDNPETPSEGMEEARAEVPQPEGMPTTNVGGSYSVPPYPATPEQAQGQSGQYSSGGSGTTDLGGGPATTPPPPAYSPEPPLPQQAPPQYDYTPPQGQPTQYMPPPQGYPQAGPPPVYTPAQPPVPQQGNYGPGYPQYQPQPMGYAQPKDPTMGLLLELLGYLGFLGIGHIWAGKTTRGVMLLVGWWIYLAISGVLTILLIGCLMLVAGIAVPIASGFYLKNEMEKEQAAMGIRR